MPESTATPSSPVQPSLRGHRSSRRGLWSCHLLRHCRWYCIIARMVDQSIYPKRVTRTTDTSATSATNYSNDVRLPKLHPTYNTYNLFHKYIQLRCVGNHISVLHNYISLIIIC